MSIYRSLRRMAGRILRSLPIVGRHFTASSGYRIVSEEEAREASTSGWLDAVTARRQHDAYRALLDQLHAGDIRIDLNVAAEGIKATGLQNPGILEVGCGNGYYVEVFECLLDGEFRYTGTDYSDAMIRTAQLNYPAHNYEVADACNLSFPDGSFDIVFNGVSLMHILDFEKAIRESRRVADKYCLYHSVPVFDDRPTTYLQKDAYGSRVVEIVFNRTELMELFEKSGLRLVKSWESIAYDVHPVTPQHSRTETFLLETAGS